jgi:hypothetical protein
VGEERARVRMREREKERERERESLTKSYPSFVLGALEALPGFVCGSHLLHRTKILCDLTPQAG